MGKYTREIYFKFKLDFSFNRKGYDWMKTYILSKLAGVHLSQYLGDYCSNQKMDIKVVSVHPGFINNHFFRDIEKHSVYWFIRDFFQKIGRAHV